MSVFLSEEEVTSAALCDLFEQAFFTAELDADGDVKVTSESGNKCYIELMADRKLLKFYCLYGFRAGADELDKLRLLNAMNDKVVFARFSMPREDVLYADYFLSYDRGLPAYQLIASYRWFTRAAVGAIRENDHLDLVE